MKPLDHLLRNSQFDVDAAQVSHPAVCDVEHYGCHCPIGEPNGPVCIEVLHRRHRNRKLQRRKENRIRNEKGISPIQRTGAAPFGPATIIDLIAVGYTPSINYRQQRRRERADIVREKAERKRQEAMNLYFCDWGNDEDHTSVMCKGEISCPEYVE